ncbi:MAG: protein-tyrosine-phosphatase [Pseudomonadales bacterium]|nr:protein-tyrosine-phosphatase [Candidatus Woesebacteria bacterium]MCB9801939.1 protein-tyrosine-phosphatase [Pseudomonadales bacterium]
MQKPNILVVCGRNKRRSRTAEEIFKHDSRFYIRSVGLSPRSRRVISGKDVLWADLILVMEDEQKAKLLQLHPQVVQAKVEVLHIPDEYECMDGELIEILQKSIEGVLLEIFRL